MKALDGFVLGIMLGICSLFIQGIAATGEFFASDAILIFTVMLFLCLAIVISSGFTFNKQQTLAQQLRAAGAAALGGAIAGALPVVLAAFVIFNHQDRLRDVEDFGRADFVQCDLNRDGTVEFLELDLILARDTRTRSDLQAFAQAKKALVEMEQHGFDYDVVRTTKAGLDAAAAELTSRLVPEERLYRINIVKNELLEAGHKISTHPTVQYGVTQQEISTYRQRLEAKYFYWLKARKLLFAR